MHIVSVLNNKWNHEIVFDADKLSFLKNLNTTFWRHLHSFMIVFKKLSDLVTEMESTKFMLTDTIVKYFTFLDIFKPDNDSQNNILLSLHTIKHIQSSFKKYLDKILTDEAVCISHFLNINNRNTPLINSLGYKCNQWLDGVC